jgi:hypothetical protein
MSAAKSSIEAAELRTAAQKAAEAPPPGPLSDVKPPKLGAVLARALIGITEQVRKSQHPLSIGIDSLCRQEYAHGPVASPLPIDVAHTLPEKLLHEAEAIWGERRELIADCEAHDWQAGVLEQRRLRDAFNKDPDPSKSPPSVEKVQKAFRLYRDAICERFAEKHRERLLTLKRLETEVHDAQICGVAFVPNMGTWGLSLLLSRFFSDRLQAITLKASTPTQLPGWAAAGADFGEGIPEVLLSLAVAEGKASLPDPALDNALLEQQRGTEKSKVLYSPAWPKFRPGRDRTREKDG